jgi:hypothetical protein
MQRMLLQLPCHMHVHQLPSCQRWPCVHAWVLLMLGICLADAGSCSCLLQQAPAGIQVLECYRRASVHAATVNAEPFVRPGRGSQNDANAAAALVTNVYGKLLQQLLNTACLT